ncbi:hypothetical protein K458DRAFT_302064 [Lentithecium fluviatile CBS 122367]|uniref:Heterokaryon incompatibility domain-containing protein n=1 Tax=Lentithecium fluviatile CBS 122367 TaxID=1168545 RepID=A0A6G1J442_9PLEO|nr:hypothetical protein K458DRAFT_302064 [Lentithecium fluviatile CBS 122367]
MAQPCIYKPLRIRHAIRLIKMLPDRVDNRVVCILHHFDQAEAPPYHALSYLWGDSTPVESIYLGDDPDHTYLSPLHENILVFLGCMWEQRMYDKFFWTDCLCLNQKDNEEKAQQVPHMGDLYANANDVLIWLGRESEKEEKLRTI